MSVRFDTNTDRLSRTTDLLDYNNPFTVMLWGRIVTDTNAGTAFFAIDDNSVNNADMARTGADGTTLQSRAVVGGSGNSVGTAALTVGQWYHIAIVRESVTALKLYVDGALDSTNTLDITGRAATTKIECGAVATNSFPLNGRVAAIKAWSTALTIDEVKRERYAICPMRSANLYGAWPCFAGATERLRDYSGNVRNWTAGGTLTDEDGPPVSWGIWTPPQDFSAAAVAATKAPPPFQKPYRVITRR